MNSEHNKFPSIHFVIDTAHPNAFTWATIELASVLQDMGVPVSIPSSTIHESIPQQKAALVQTWMKDKPEQDVHIKWSHFWPHHMEAPLFGKINVEIMCTNYRYKQDAVHHDLWTRHVQLNGYHKVPVSGFNQSALEDIGFTPDACPVIPLGYSPEIKTLFPDGRFPSSDSNAPLNILIVTNSNDLYRYGTDMAIAVIADAFTDEDNVIIHIKDYGASVDNGLLKQWIEQYDRFPDVQWHDTFVSKETLLNLYASMDFLLAPYRGEGFSMKILDAMAIGIPVMMPAFGGPMEYAGEGTFLPVKFNEVPVGDCFDRHCYPLGDEIYWCEPDQKDLTAQLRRTAEDRTQLTETGKRARKAVIQRFSWEHIAAEWLRVLQIWIEEHDRLKAAIPPSKSDLISVLIPTKNRVDVLEKTLQAFMDQTLPRSEYELVIINDYGDYEPLKELCDGFTELPIQLFDNEGTGGRSPARNLGVTKTRGDIVLFIGDDIVPSPEFLQTHRKAHNTRPEKTAAFLGYTDWHPELDVTPFENMLAGEGGHQFDYRGCHDDAVISYHQFYTCNISLKRDFLIEQDALFDPIFPYGFEDIELAYRLHLQGMELRFLEAATGFHHHQTSPSAYLQRQYNMGEDLFLFVLKQPSTDVARDLMPLLLSMEEKRISNWDGINTECSPMALNAEILHLYNAIMAWMQKKQPDNEEWLDWFNKTHRGVWECMNELALRTGMARAWSTSEEDRIKAVSWITMIYLPRVIGPTPFYNQMPPEGGTPNGETPPAVLFKNSLFIYHASNALRTCPFIGSLIRRLEETAFVRKLKTRA